MKGIVKDIIVFVSISIIVAAGVFSKSFYDGIKTVSDEPGIVNFISSINEIDKSLSYHDSLVDLESLVLRVTGTDYVKKSEDETVIKTADDLLCFNDYYVSDEDIATICTNIAKLKTVANENGAEFLYVLAPSKNMDSVFPAGVINYSLDNYARYKNALNKSGVELLDLKAAKEAQGISNSEMFFATDHHWKPESGLWATELICKELGSRYGFEYDEYYTDINNYNQKVYEDWFLGSEGKKVGRYFTARGVDDITLITPKFETSMVEKQPMKNQTRSGSFEETVLYQENINERDYYHLSPYSTYSGGDFRLQIMQNLNADNDVKILMVRDSFACAVSPFLALNCSELYMLDIRHHENYVGKKVNPADYIAEVKPDYVIVLYNEVKAIDHSDGRYNFFF